jgi:hypothetical protein
MLTFKKLGKAFLYAWDEDTCQGEWNPQIPSLNQCAVTALVVQDYFGGEMIRCSLSDNDSHYWNKLPDGNEIDFTFSQFAYTNQVEMGDNVIRTREYVLSFPDTLARYKLLKNEVEYYLRTT